MFLVDELRRVENNEDLCFDTYCEKRYVLADILTFMCPELKKRLKAAGKIDNRRLRNINNMMVHLEDENYEQWDNIEDHLSLRKLNGVLL